MGSENTPVMYFGSMIPLAEKLLTVSRVIVPLSLVPQVIDILQIKKWSTQTNPHGRVPDLYSD